MRFTINFMDVVSMIARRQVPVLPKKPAVLKKASVREINPAAAKQKTKKIAALQHPVVKKVDVAQIVKVKNAVAVHPPVNVKKTVRDSVKSITKIIN